MTPVFKSNNCSELCEKVYEVVAAGVCFLISNLCEATNHSRWRLGHAHQRPDEVMSVGPLSFFLLICLSLSSFIPTISSLHQMK